MLSYNVFTILFLLFLSQINIAYEAFIKTGPTWNEFDLKSIVDRRVNITCHDDSRSNCTVFAEKFVHSDGNYSCIVYSENQSRTHFGLQGRLDIEKVVLVWQEFMKNQSIFKFGILHLNNCHVTVSVFEVEILEKPVINVHKNGFDVFFKNSTLCGQKLCRTNFDIDGKMLKPAQNYLKENCFRVKPIASNVSKETFVYICKDDKQNGDLHRSALDGGWIKFSELFEASNHSKLPFRDGFYLIKADGTKILLAEDNGQSFTSTTRGLISICAIYDTYINCSQFDVQGHLKFNRILSGGSDDFIEILDTRNLRQGGFLLLLKEYWDCSEKTGPRDMCHHVTLGKFDAKGKIVGSTVVEGYYGSKMDMYEDEEGYYCTISSHGKKSSIFWGEKKMNFSYKCFNVTDLSQRPF